MLRWLTSPNPAGICMMLAILGMISGAVVLALPPRGEADSAVDVAKGPQTVMHEPLDVDELPITPMDPSRIPPSKGNIERLKLTGRLAEGILTVAHHKGAGQWWECGKVYDKSEETDAAIEWASRIAFLAHEYSDNGSTDGIMINPWGIAGTAANESGFDRCALGKWPRLWGYEHGTITKRKRCISHPFDQIKATLMHPEGQSRWGSIGLDAAPLHVLWRCKEGRCRPKWNREGLPAISLEEVFSLGKGFSYNVREMKKRAINNKTDRPWAYWRGYHSSAYDAKVTRWARMMGARPDEI